MSKLDEFEVVVFDLDDTLFSENDYVASGYDCVSDTVQRLYGVPFRDLISDAQRSGAKDALGHALEAAELPASLKEHLLAIYRYHRPTLKLHPGALQLLEGCRSRGCPLYLVTDGRSLTQRLKIEALGIGNFFERIFISEEVGRGKPDPFSFQTIADLSNRGPWVYVADNPGKDFLAPNLLGWTTIGVRHTGSRVHPVGRVAAEPSWWVEELSDLL